jgi:hypothetical protein
MRNLLIFLTLVFSKNIFACQCTPTPLKYRVLWPDIIFVGDVTKIEYVDGMNIKNGEPRIIVTFSVSGYFKGNQGETVVLHTYHNTRSCAGFVFEKNKKYVVFARKDSAKDWLGSSLNYRQLKLKKLKETDTIFGTDICRGTGSFDGYSEIEELERLKTQLK